MISAEVQRTLVKSPPELWAELSDEAALARHLCELGEVKITTTKPEQTVEWEAEAAHGKVELKPSGWGTKVTLSITQEAPIEAHRASGTEKSQKESPKAGGEREPEGEPELEGERELEVEPEPEVGQEPQAAVEPASEAAAPTAEKPARARRFFARLFRRRSDHATVEMTPRSTEEPGPAAESTAPDEPAIAAEQGATAEQAATTAQSPATEQGATTAQSPATAQATDLEPRSADLAAELAVAEQEIVQQTTELLNGVLDRLGAAHHRPFSRA